MKKVWTTFLIPGHDPVNSAHITHHFFGDVTEEEFMTIKKMIVHEFLEGGPRFQTFVTRFFYEAVFMGKYVTELLPRIHYDFLPTEKNNFRVNLRNQFEANFPLPTPYFPYRPHITGNYFSPGTPILVKGFALVADGKVRFTVDEGGLHYAPV